MTVDSVKDIDGLRRAGKAVRAAFEMMKVATEPGITTAQLDAIGAKELRAHGAKSAPQLYYEFPGATCISVNEEAAHGIPGQRVLKEGDMINIDVSAELGGYVADMGESFLVGNGTQEQQHICESVKFAVYEAIKQVRAGLSLNVIGKTVHQIAVERGYSIVANLGSHGVGASIHEEPSYVPTNNPREKRVLTDGLVLTIEPFFTTGGKWVEEGDDGWTLFASAGSLVAQYEHTIIVTQSEPIIITQAA